MTTAPIRIAQPGDVFVLLEPSDDQLARLKQHQLALQARFGGQPHQRIHVTCQRFVLPPRLSLGDLTTRLRQLAATVRPLPIIATELATHTSPFWQSRLLRWQVQATEEVCHFAETLEHTLRALGIAPHFNYKTWQPSAHVTILEDLPIDSVHTTREIFPQHLFLASKLVVSRITDAKVFDILDQARLGGNQATGD